MTAFDQALRQAGERLRGLNQTTQQVRTQQAQTQQSTNQLATAYVAMARSIAEQTRAYAQAQQASLAYRREQDQLREALRRQREEQRQATEASQRAGAGLRSMLSVAGGIGIATGLGAIVGQLKEMAIQTVQVGTRFESLRASLSALSSGGGAGGSQFNMLVDMAQRLGVALEPLAHGWRTLTAAASQANLPLADQQRLLTALATEGRRTGASNEELGRAIQAVGQMASKGKVSMEELRQQIGEAIPTAVAAAARGMGRTTEELIKLVETGRVSFVPFAQALTRGFEQMQAAGGQFAEGSREAFNRLGNAWKILQDTIMRSGLNTYLQQVAKNLQEAVEWTTRLLKSRQEGGPQGPPLGMGTPDMPGLGIPAEQEKEIRRLQGIIAPYSRLAETAPNPAHRAQYAEMVKNAREQLEQVLATVRATQDQAIAQAQVTAETNKTLDVQARQKAFNEEFAKATEKLAKDTATFRAEAALSPALRGRPTGTADEVVEFNKNLQKVQREHLDALTAMVAARGTDIQLTEQQRQTLRGLNVQYEQGTKAIDAAREAEEKRLQKQRETAQRREAAEGATPGLTSLLEQAAGFGARAEQDTVEQARSRVEGMARALRTQLARALEQVGDNPFLQHFQAQLQTALEALPSQTTALSDRMAGEVNERLRQRIQAMGHDVSELVREWGGVTESPLDKALAEMDVKALKAFNRLRELRDAFASLRETATPERQTEIDSQLRTLDDLIQRWEALRQAQRDVVTTAPFTDSMRALQRQLAGLQGRQGGADSEVLRLFGGGQTRAGLKAETLLEKETQQGAQFTAEQQRQLDLMRQKILVQERMNYVMGLTEEIGRSAANTISDGLVTMILEAQRVGKAFEAMAKTILDSIARIALNEGFRLLIGVGLQALGGVVGGALGAQAGGAALDAFASTPAYQSSLPLTPTPYRGFQHGGVINKPTLALLGEGSTNPEYVLNRHQMANLMRAGPSAGGQATGGISIINVPNQEVAAREAAAQRAMGREVIINTVMSELSAGSGSRIGQVMKTVLR